MDKKIIVTAGCSFTKDNFQSTWADYFSTGIGYHLDNVAARGAGIQFAHKRLLYRCNESRPDIVVVMLPSADRFDWYIDYDHPLKEDAIEIASWQNGRNPDLVRIDGTITQHSGYSLTGGEIRGHKKYFYKYYYTEPSALIDYWTNVLAMQNFLKVQGIDYFFTMAYDRDQLVEQDYNRTGQNDDHRFLLDMIDWNKFALYQGCKGFLSYVKDNGFKVISNHPVDSAHQSFVENVLLPYYRK